MGAAGRPAPARADGHTCPPRGDGPRVNGVRIDAVSHREFISAVEGFLACGKSHVVHFCAAHPTTEARRDPAYRDLLNGGDLNLPDGMPVAWAARLFGYPTARLAGTEGLDMTAAWGLPLGLRHYLYGGAPATVERMAAAMRQGYPGIVVAGAESPPFRPLSDEEVRAGADRIRGVGTQALWVGLGAPKQDVVAARFRELGAAPVIFCVGAAFDFVAGDKKRAPAWMRRSGLEWLHRLASEPMRLWRRYLVGNPRFVAGVVADRMRGGRARGKAR